MCREIKQRKVFHWRAIYVVFSSCRRTNLLFQFDLKRIKNKAKKAFMGSNRESVSYSKCAVKYRTGETFSSVLERCVKRFICFTHEQGQNKSYYCIYNYSRIFHASSWMISCPSSGGFFCTATLSICFNDNCTFLLDAAG